MFKKLLVLLSFIWAGLAFAAVDVNKGTAAELDGVKGIGPALSSRIVDERKKGNFKDWNDFIERVKGVGEGNAAKFSAEGLTVNGAGFKGAAPAAKKDDKKADAKADAKAAKADDKKADAKADAKSDKKVDAKAEAKAKKEADAKAKAEEKKKAAEEKKKAAEEKKAKKEADKKAKAEPKADAKADAKAGDKKDAKPAADKK